jgi:hypothetical protein
MCGQPSEAGDGAAPRRIKLRVPAGVAAAMVDDGCARKEPTLRSAIPSLVVDGAAIATTMISLLQGPSAVADTAKFLHKWLGDSSSKGPEDESPDDGSRITISAEGPNGRIVIEVDAATDLNTIAEFLRQTVLPP